MDLVFVMRLQCDCETDWDAREMRFERMINMQIHNGKYVAIV